MVSCSTPRDRALLLAAAICLFLPHTPAQAAVGDILLTLSNPTKDTDERFGASVASLGDLIAVGTPRSDDRANEAGAVYLFNRQGTLVRSITSPTPDAFDWFGQSVTAVGDNFLVGASQDDTWEKDAGGGYLFNKNGQLLATYFSSHPTQLSGFASSTASGGSDVVIGSYREGVNGLTDAGVVYRFSPQGTLLNLIENPTPQVSDLFGRSVARTQNRIYVGAPNDSTRGERSGAVYVYDLSGRLLNTIYNPTPAADDNFGVAIATFADQLIISATLDDTAGPNSGAAYVFDSSGRLIDTLLNPRRASNEQFGASIQVLGGGITISAPSHRQGTKLTGAVDFFDFNGDHVKSVNNPGAAGIVDQFGFSISAHGRDLIVGNPAALDVRNNTGKAYLLEGLPIALPGDVNGDFRVDLRDFSLVRKNFGGTGGRASGDASGDGQIDISDFALVRTTFGKSAGALFVPEPHLAASLVLLPALLALLGRHRRTEKGSELKRALRK